MTTTNIEATTATNYRIRGSSPTYATARSTASGIAVYFKTGQDTNYNCDRIFFKFDTSVIGTDVVSDVKLRLVCVTDESVTDFDIQICEQDWSAQDALSTGNMEAAFDACLAEADYFTWRNTSGMSTNTQYTGPSMTPGYVNTSGYTYYSLRSGEDYSNSQPSTTENVTLGEPGNATAAYRPVLIVTHAPASAGSIPVVMYHYMNHNK